MALRDRKKRHVKDVSARRRKVMVVKEAFQKGPSLGFSKSRGRGGENYFQTCKTPHLYDLSVFGSDHIFNQSPSV